MIKKAQYLFLLLILFISACKPQSILSPPIGSGYYYNTRLTDEEKHFYWAIQTGIEALEDEIILPINSINIYSRIFEYILLDNPKIFYVTEFTQINNRRSKKSTLKPIYKYDKTFIIQSLEEIENYLKRFDIVKIRSDIQKELYVHDYILQNYQYDYTFHEQSHSVLGPIFRKTAVCDGIAKFVKLALNYLNVNCIVVEGKSLNPPPGSHTDAHAWNIVEIGPNTFHLDVTFNMTLTKNIFRYDFFNLSDKEIENSHIILNNVPECNTSGRDYYTMNGMVVNSFSELEIYIENKLRQNNANFVVKLLGIEYSQSVLDQVMALALNKYGSFIRPNSTGQVDVNHNPSRMVFEIIYM
ncbi:MAG: hypothetical protein FWG98_02650 [Candidatus Cloacimonetes bacterium]|nr:hypothetical protein [Candidatus Cloacimonadota bacterium]